MEKRSRRRTRDLVTQAASQGLSENEIGCARISMMARSTNAPCKGRIQMRKTTPSIYSNSACNARPVHTVGSFATGPSRQRLPVALSAQHEGQAVLVLQFVGGGRLGNSDVVGGQRTVLPEAYFWSSMV